MKFVGVDLHKETISICVMVKEAGKRKVTGRKRLRCEEPEEICSFFEQLGAFQVVVEATSSYEWFLLLVEDLAEHWVLAHPKKLRVIAESKNKSDKIDAQVLAEFLLLDMLPESYRPSPRTRQHRVLVRHRHWLQGRITSIKCKLRHKLAHYNADVAELFTRRGQEHLARLAMSHADRFECQALSQQLTLLGQQLKEVDAALRVFAETAPAAEREARAVLVTIPQVGPVTIDVVPKRVGRPASLPQRQTRVLLRRARSGLPRKRGEGEAAVHQQGGFSAAALGVDRNGLAPGEHVPSLAHGV